MTFLNKTIAVATASIIAASGAAFADGHSELPEFDVNSARLDVTLDMNGDGDVSDDEIVRGNMELFDTDGNNIIDATEQDRADTILNDPVSSTATFETGLEVEAPEATTMTDAAMDGDLSEFDINAARLDVTLDENGDGDVSDDEIVRGNMALFDLDANGIIDATEQSRGEDILGEM